MGNYIQEAPKGQRVGECKGRGDIGVHFDPSTGAGYRRLNEPRGEAGKVLEPVERPGAGENV